MFCLVLSLTFGLCLGLVAHWLGLGRENGRLFRVLIGLPVALVAAPFVVKGLAPQWWGCCCLGLAILAAVAHEHYLEFREFPQEYAGRMQMVLEGQALQQTVKDYQSLSKSFDRIAEDADQWTPEQRDQLKETRRRRDAFADDMQEISNTADRLASSADDPDLAPILKVRRSAWDDVRREIHGRGVSNMALDDAQEIARRPSAEVARVLHSVGFREHLAVKAEQGAPLPFFDHRRLGAAATVLVWIIQFLLAAASGCLLLRFVSQKRSSATAAGQAR